MKPEPKSLQEAIVYFSNPDNCIDYLVVRRWPDGVVICPTCGSSKLLSLRIAHLDCAAVIMPKREFSIKVGTVMEDSAIPLDKWITATWMVTNCKNGISSYEIARDIKVTQKSAWFMLHRIRLAMQDDSLEASSRAKSKRTKLSSAARLGTCTSRNASAASPALAAKIKPPSWESWNAAARFALSRSEPAQDPASGSPQACRSWRGALYRCAAVL